MQHIDTAALWAATDGGKQIILKYYPQACVGFSGRKNFRIRPDDKSPSASVFLNNRDGGKFWYIQDKGGSDTKARNAIMLVMEHEGLNYGEAIRKIAAEYAPQLLSDTVAVKQTRQPEISKSPVPLDEIQLERRPGNKFTDTELAVLGHEINAENCAELALSPLEYYITRRNESGDSWIIKATPDYPIFYFDHGEFGKIYQPFGEIRFMYVGKKPDSWIFGDVKVARLIADARRSIFPEVNSDTNVDERLERLVICSGPSDALNVAAHGYHVCWLNSETADIDSYSFYLLRKITKDNELYILYDIDDTGRKASERIAMKHLDIRIIRLPDDLSRFRDRKGKPCKDAKDFFVHYRTPKHRNPKKHFDALVKTAQSLKFWAEKYDSKGNPSGYEIDNEQLYGFLHATGIWKIATTTNLKGFTFCQVAKNIVERIDEDNITHRVNEILVRFIKENPEYYSKQLLNSIHRSNQVKTASLEKLRFGAFDFKSFGRDFDFFFFKNTALRITAEGLFPYKLAQVGKHVLQSQIIDHEFTLDEAPFDISYRPEYDDLRRRLAAALPRTPEYDEIKAKVDGMKEADKYMLNIYSDFSFVKFIYNTGKVYWRKEQNGFELTEEEQREQDMYFIAKICAIGYMLYRYKERGQAYLLYAMETELSEVGTHLGGTGKSLLVQSLEYCRNQWFVDGRSPDKQKSEHLFSGVEKGVTDLVFFDDLHKDIDLHRFLNIVTGKMEVRALYRNTEVIDFEESPKVAAASNHGIKDFDASLRRRTWFMAFSDYYHPEDSMNAMPERSPFSEFGKNLIVDYSVEEMNQFFNFMSWCMHTYLKFRRRIQPPMEAIERRNIQRAITDEFIWWADDWFTEDRLNTNIDKEAAFAAWKLTLTEPIAKVVKMQTFTGKLKKYCYYRGWIYNPPELMQTDTERKRNDIRDYKEGKDVYCFHIRTNASASAPAPSINLNDSKFYDELTRDEPPF